jgi:hypothetical protein
MCLCVYVSICVYVMLSFPAPCVKLTAYVCNVESFAHSSALIQVSSWTWDLFANVLTDFPC